ncbi:repressor LexA [Candidatus Woesearchaeota archaeon]|jgi:repressor LexA|nr:repressor LexA [Candidatus Woesearchaeota archaeon]MDP6740219.1 transcriptional repressor LexA [Planctomycetota bacterium]MDP6937732.1 transcriptional repressor LexA [Planctomycetota bacterium]
MSSVPLTRRQRQIVDFFQEYTRDNGLSPTYEEIAEHFGVNKVTIFGHVSELERKGVLRRNKRGTSRNVQLVEPDSPAPGYSHTSQVAILGNIAAGGPIETIEEPEALDLAAMMPDDKDIYALRVAGDSMIDDAIADGDVVLVERREDARNGETVVAVLPDETCTLKRLYREEDHVRLQPANETMDPIYVDEVNVRGVVIGVLRKY